MNKTKNFFLKLLYRFWSVGIPLILASFFGVGVFFFLWRSLGLSLYVVIPTAIIIAASLIFSIGKMIKIW